MSDTYPLEIFNMNPVILVLFGSINLIIPIICKKQNSRFFLMFFISLLYLGSAIIYVFSYSDSMNGISAVNASQVQSKEFFKVEFNSLKLFFSMSPLGIRLFLLIAVLWPIAISYTEGYIHKQERHQARFLFMFNLCILLSSLVCFAGNFFTILVVYELISLSTILLIRHDNTARTDKALKHYLIALILPSIMLLIPSFTILQYHYGDIYTSLPVSLVTSNRLNIFLSLLILFGVAKAAVFPSHTWLPVAMIAPYPVSALLHAVAIVNVGVFCLLTIISSVFYSSTEILCILQYFAAFSVVFSSVKALTQNTIKKLLAYSTISNLSLIALTSFIGNQEAMSAAITHIITHSLGKITLFFAAGCMYTVKKCTNISDCKSIGYILPISTICFVIASFSIMGLPPFAGFVSKYSIILAAIKANNHIVTFSTIISSLLSCCYLSKIIKLSYTEDSKIYPNYLEPSLPRPMLYATISSSILVIVYPITAILA